MVCGTSFCRQVFCIDTSQRGLPLMFPRRHGCHPGGFHTRKLRPKSPCLIIPAWHLSPSSQQDFTSSSDHCPSHPCLMAKALHPFGHISTISSSRCHPLTKWATSQPCNRTAGRMGLFFGQRDGCDRLASEGCSSSKLSMQNRRFWEITHENREQGCVV